MAEDRCLYDPSARTYTVDRYLDDLRSRYGGLDAVLIWPTYPNIGIDDRNQLDLVADMPGGLEGVRQMVTDFRKRGVRVFFPIMIWDKGTRDPGMPIAVALVKEMKVIGADGLNGDTMFGVTEDFLQACDSLQYPLVLQPEVAINQLKMTEWNQMSWGYFWKYEYIPGVSVPKWLEPKHQVQVTNRWIVDKTDDLQYAFFNGVGYNAWENIWGIWNQVPARYAEEIRRIAAIYRQFPGIWNSAGWRPHTPTLQQGVFASLFPGTDMQVYTLVNRDSTDHRGRQLQAPYQTDMRYFDLWNGRELTARREGDKVSLEFPLEGRGFGAVLAARPYAIDSGFYRFLAAMRVRSKRPLKDYSVAWAPLPQRMVNVERAFRAAEQAGRGKAPEGMVFIPGTDGYLFESRGVMIEGDDLPTAVGVQHPWENHPSRSQQHSMKVSPFYIDKYPVTNRQFKTFLDASHYRPADGHNFLKDWINGEYPGGWDDKPVTWVSIEDARAYARWAGKRLPHEWEWQYAAQGGTRRTYPWGNAMDSSRIPIADTSRERRPPSDVHAYPAGGSVFGVMDMIGNVWQWTDEYMDDHTRSAILKGGSYYRPRTSMWYFPQALELNKYGKYLLMAPSIDRSGTIGFRCAADGASNSKITINHN
ncbi:MAG: SUMF1/EgtB/PvdO family nonheme iron enzyme [Bacteroidetes bacterium]|nr:SUMF1/EgtB/PvdO family nonheme iron enzyme [Bacteroidota bacterium]